MNYEYCWYLEGIKWQKNELHEQKETVAEIRHGSSENELRSTTVKVILYSTAFWRGKIIHFAFSNELNGKRYSKHITHKNDCFES